MMTVAALAFALARIAQDRPGLRVQGLFMGVEDEGYAPMEFDVEGVVVHHGVVYLASSDVIVGNCDGAFDAWDKQRKQAKD